MVQYHEIIILGGGAAGLTAASILSDKYPNILILESFSRLGGTHRSIEANGFTFDIGSFLFYPHNILFQRHPRLLDTTVPATCQQERIRPDGKVRTYPFALQELREISNWQKTHFFLSLLKGKLATGPCKSLELACHRMLGRAFYEYSGLSNYVARFYGPDLPDSLISPVFVDKRLQFLKQRTRLDAALKMIWRASFAHAHRRKVTPLGHGVVGRVRGEAGFPEMYAPVAEDLAQKGVTIQLDAPLESICKTGNRFELVSRDGIFSSAQIVSTVPIELLMELIEGTGSPRLPSSPLLTLCVSFAGSRGFDGGILFNFHASGRWKRLTMHSDFYGVRQDREYFSVEVPVSAAHPLSDAEAFADFGKSVRALGLFKGDLRLEESVLTPLAYPRYEIGYEEPLANMLAKIDEFGIITVGRQGRFDYLPTSGAIGMQVTSLLQPMLTL